MLSLLAAVVLSQCDGGHPCTAYPAVTNHVRSSQDLMWGWSSYGGCSVETNTTMAPACAESFNTRGCGRQTAGRIHCPAVADGVNAFVYQSDVCPSGMRSAAAYLRASDGGTATPGLYVGGAVYANEVSGWVRVGVENVATGSTTFAIGNFGPRPALDVDFWQADCQDSAVLLPPVVTGARPVRREAGCVASSVRKVAGLGDSIMLASGTGLPQVAVRVAEALGPDYAPVEAGVAGDTCADVRARWPALRDAGVSHLVVMCGVNDARTGRSASQAWEDLSAVLADASDAGVKVRPVLTLNFEGAGDADATKVATINTLRGYIAAWCVANNVACADPAAALQSGDALKTEYRQDGTHPNAAGSTLFVSMLTSWPQRWEEGW